MDDYISNQERKGVAQWIRAGSWLFKTMARYGIVRMEKVRRNIRPIIEATDFTVQFGLYAPSRGEHGAGAVRI
jgi:predicted transcriptional regulator